MGPNSFLENENPVEFLYLDRERISSLIGQSSDQGVLTGFKSSVTATRGREGHAEGGAPLLGKVGGSRSRLSTEYAEHTYDPFWQHAPSFLRDLEANFAVPLENSTFGSLVKFESFVQCIDVRIMRNFWGVAVDAFIGSIPTGPKATPEQRAQAKHFKDNKQMILTVMAEMPHLLHMTFLSTAGLRLWAAAKPNSLTMSSEDLVMKFGSVLDGKWNVVGIVDAFPGAPTQPFKVSDGIDGIITAMGQYRQMFGRPTDHFGLTPLAIYMPLVGISETEVTNAP